MRRFFHSERAFSVCVYCDTGKTEYTSAHMHRHTTGATKKNGHRNTRQPFCIVILISLVRSRQRLSTRAAYREHSFIWLSPYGFVSWGRPGRRTSDEAAEPKIVECCRTPPTFPKTHHTRRSARVFRQAHTSHTRGSIPSR